MRVLFLLVSILVTWACSACLPAARAESPALALRLEDLNAPASLAGEWEFTGPDGRQGLVHVPDSWEKFYGRRLPLHGSGHYRLRVLLPPEAIGQILQLSTNLIAGNRFEFRINGRLAGHNGRRLGSLSRVPYFYPFRVDKRELLIEAEIENQIQHYSGIVNPLWLGTVDAIQSLRLRDKMGLNLVLGIFLFLGLFHLLLYAGFRQDKAFFWFGVLCLAVGLYSEFFLAHNFETLVMELPIDWSIRITRIGLYSVIPAFLWYAYHISPSYISPRFVRFVSYLSLGFLLSTVLPGRWYLLLTNLWFLTMAMFIVYNLYQLMRFARLREVRPFLFSGVVFSGTVVNDILNAVSLLHTGFIGRFGFLLFCFTQAGFLAWRLQSSYKRSQALQTELLEVNQNLEGLISERTQEVRAQNEELQKLGRFKDEMTQMLVHDLKAPLNALIHLPAQAGGESQQRLQSIGQGMLTLIDQMLSVKDIEQSELLIQPSRQEPRALCDRVLKTVSAWAQGKKISLQNQIEPGLWLNLDPAHFERVIQNLLDNAIKHTPIGGTIRLGSDAEPGQLRLWIADTGPGLKPEQMKLAFERRESFARGATPRSSGLGLYYCRQVLEAHGGQIAFDPDYVGGCRVLLSLPLAEAAPQQAAPAWSARQLDLLRPVASQLAEFEVYALTHIENLLQTLRANEDKLIQDWVQALERTVYEVDETAYVRLIAQITQYSDR